MAARLLLTAERATRAIDLVREGHTRTAIARAIGVGESTLRNWLERGEREPDREPWGSFARDFRGNEGLAEVDIGDAILGAAHSDGRRDWKALAWWLERRYPKRYGAAKELPEDAKERIIGEILARLEGRLPPDLLARVLDAISPPANHRQDGGGAPGSGLRH